MADIDLERLAKIWALVERGTGGESGAARDRAAAMVEPHGYVIEDIPDLLAEAGLAGGEPQPGPGGFTFCDLNNPAHMRAYAREKKARRRKWMRDNADRIAEVIARYGSQDAVFTPTAVEKALDAAIGPFRDPPKEGSFQTWDGESFRPTPRVAEAIGRVISWPESIPDALAEYEQWEKLCDDRNATDGNNQYDYLSEGADLRRNHLQDMVEKLLPSRDLSDLIVRMRFLIGLDRRIENPEAILADLERLNAANALNPDTVQSERGGIVSRNGTRDGNIRDSQAQEDAAPPFNLNTATARRAEVKRILGTAEGQRMTLRQIAALAGVSPATVLNIRRRMEAGVSRPELVSQRVTETL